MAGPPGVPGGVMGNSRRGAGVAPLTHRAQVGDHCHSYLGVPAPWRREWETGGRPRVRGGRPGM